MADRCWLSIICASTVELNSLWHRALSFREIAVDGLVVNAVQRPGGALNFSDLQSDEPPAAEAGAAAACHGG